MRSWLPFGPEKDAWKHTVQRAKSLLKFDEIRIMQLMETIQYGAIYFFLGFSLGTALDSIFPKFDETKPVSEVLLEVLGQSIAFIIFVFYTRKLAKLFPFLFELKWDLDGDGKIPRYHPYRSLEYSGELTIGLVVVSTQLNMIKKIDLLSREVYSRYLGLDTRIKSAF